MFAAACLLCLADHLLRPSHHNCRSYQHRVCQHGCCKVLHAKACIHLSCSVLAQQVSERIWLHSPFSKGAESALFEASNCQQTLLKLVALTEIDSWLFPVKVRYGSV